MLLCVLAVCAGRNLRRRQCVSVVRTVPSSTRIEPRRCDEHHMPRDVPSDAECRMVAHPGMVAFPALSGTGSETFLRRATGLPSGCRARELKPAHDAESCAQRCLEQPFCAAATFFGSNSSALGPTLAILRGRCFGRTSGPESGLSPIAKDQADAPRLFKSINHSASMARLDTSIVSVFRSCLRPGCGLQSRLDLICASLANRSLHGHPCHRARLARNRHAVKSFNDEEHFEWVCTAPEAEDIGQGDLRTRPPVYACVDDRGHMLPCDFVGPASGACRLPMAIARSLVHTHREGCGPPACVAVPGAGASTPDGADGARKERARASSSMHAQHPAASPRPQPTQHPSWRPANLSRRVGELRRLGYFECIARIDEGKAKCPLKQGVAQGQMRWLDWMWSAPVRDAGEQRRLTSRAQQVSWWHDPDRDAADSFDPDRFLASLRRLANATGKPPEVQFVGDSTSRQQAVSLCCLLSASAAPEFYQVNETLAPRNDRKLGFSCQVVRENVVLAKVVFSRIYRGDSGHTNRNKLEPRPTGTFLNAVRRAPPVLILSFGTWDYQESCDNRLPSDLASQIHLTLCGNSRPWLLHHYAQKWAQVVAALQEAYPEGSPLREHSLVMVRTNAPRSDECKNPKQKDCFQARATCSRPEPVSEASGHEGSLEQKSLDLHSGTMRFAVMSQNAIMIASVWQRAPWVRVLDAYGIARLRVDAHPENGDCTHYCMPGVPDVWNGRLLSTMLSPATVGLPSEVLARWNFAHPIIGRPFVRGEPPHLAFRFYNVSIPLQCPHEQDHATAHGIGMCSDLPQ